MDRLKYLLVLVFMGMVACRQHPAADAHGGPLPVFSGMDFAAQPPVDTSETPIKGLDHLTQIALDTFREPSSLFGGQRLCGTFTPDDATRGEYVVVTNLYHLAVIQVHGKKIYLKGAVQNELHPAQEQRFTGHGFDLQLHMPAAEESEEWPFIGILELRYQQHLLRQAITGHACH